MTRVADRPPDSILLIALMVDALGEHPTPEAAAEDTTLRGQWADSGEVHQRRVLVAVARDSRDKPPPPGGSRVQGYVRWLQTTATAEPDGEPELGPTIPETPVALASAMILLDLVRDGRDRPGQC